MKRICRNGVGGFVAIALLTFASATAEATVYTFDTAADLTNNFYTDVRLGDAGTAWHAGYTASGGFPASSGGFVMFDAFNSANSIAFKNGPQDLISFDISSQYLRGGVGVSDAATALNDYHLRLYAQNLTTILYDAVLTVAPNGAWTTVNLNVDDVYAIWIDKRSGDGTGTGGWWPNIDNVRLVPEPASIVVWSIIGSAGAGFSALRRRRQSKAESVDH